MNTVTMPYMGDINGVDQRRGYKHARSDTQLQHDEENVDLEEADELNSDHGSSAKIAMQ